MDAIRLPGFGPLVQESLLTDESGLAGHADFVAFPACTKEAAAALRAAHTARVPVVLQGARTGLCGGGVPRGGAVVSTARMNHPLAFSFDETRLCGSLTVQAGATLEQVRRALRSKSCDESLFDEPSKAAWALYRKSALELEFLPNPTEESATLGGIAACNASGARFCGAVASHLSGLVLALPNGEIARYGTGATAPGAPFAEILKRPGEQAHRQEAGYRTGGGMLELLCGSEGTLGLICELTLELRAAPALRQGVWIPFETVAQMGAFWESFFPAANALARNPLRGADCYGGCCFSLLRSDASGAGGVPASLTATGPEGAVLLLELASFHEDDLYTVLEMVLTHLEAEGIPADDVAVASDANQLAAMTEFRHKVVETAMLSAAGAPYLAADACVPAGAFPALFGQLAHSLASQSGYLMGRPGAGTLNVRLLCGKESRTEAQDAYEAILQTLAQESCVCSAEYGVGRLKRPLFSALSPARAAAAGSIRSKAELFAGLNPGVLADVAGTSREGNR